MPRRRCVPGAVAGNIAAGVEGIGVRAAKRRNQSYRAADVHVKRIGERAICRDNLRMAFDARTEIRNVACEVNMLGM